MRVGVGVDEPGVKELAACIHDGRVGRRREPGRADLGDGVAGDQDVGRVGAVGAGVEDTAAADDRRHEIPPPLSAGL